MSETDGLQTRPTLPFRIAREFHVGQPRPVIRELIRADIWIGAKIFRPGDADCADDFAIAIEREAAGENGDAIGQVRIPRESAARRLLETHRFLETEIRPVLTPVDTRREKLLGEKTNG